MRDPADRVYPQSLAFMRVLGVLQGRLHSSLQRSTDARDGFWTIDPLRLAGGDICFSTIGFL